MRRRPGPGDDDGHGVLPEALGRPAVPPPRAASTSDDAPLSLALGAIGIALPLVAPFAWWLAARTARRLRARGSDVPATTRTALTLGMLGTLLLATALVCGAAFLLFG